MNNTIFISKSLRANKQDIILIDSFCSHFDLTNEPSFNRSEEEINKRLLKLGEIMAKFQELIKLFGDPIIQNNLISWSFLGKGDEIIFIYKSEISLNLDEKLFWSLYGNKNAQKEKKIIKRWIRLKLNDLRCKIE